VAGSEPFGVAFTPNDAVAYVSNYNTNTVTPITVSTNTAGTAIAVGARRRGCHLPSGAIAYVANQGSNTVTPITVATNTAGTPITVGSSPTQVPSPPTG